MLQNNKVVAIGQIAMASFKNPAGLYKEGKTCIQLQQVLEMPLYRDGVGADKSNEKGYGDIIQGRLEMSNVDPSGTIYRNDSCQQSFSS